MKRNLKIVLVTLLVMAVVVLGGCLFWVYRYRQSHVFVEGTAYHRETSYLNLQGQSISQAHFDDLQAQLPGCRILWDVPFQGQRLPSSTQEITVTSLTAEDVQMLRYFPELKKLNAQECRDYEVLEMLEQKLPDCEILYGVTINGQPVDRQTQALDLAQADFQELEENLKYLPQLKKLHFAEGALDAQSLISLQNTYPEMEISWEKTVLGQTYPSSTQELDFSGTPLTGVEELEEAMAYFPALEKLILCDCGVDNETMAAFRERVKEDYEVVWRVQLGRTSIRTDATTFMPRKEGINMQNHEMENLKYCQDMLVVDVGHMGLVVDLDWLYGMPHLQFLVLVGTGVKDLTPIGSLKELIYLELFKCPYITDYSPLVGCTALEDVNLAFTHGDSKVFAQMPWLKHLWINQTGVDEETRALLLEALPDTVIEFDHGWHMGNGWRGLDNYFVMRDLLEMPYYDWGNPNKET